MRNYTYEANDLQARLETYEWDRMWIEKANDVDTHRVLYIGDSISWEMRKYATEVMGGKLYFDGYATSKALDNPFFYDNIRIFSKEEKYRNAVVFNNGLHGWHLDDTVKYGEEYEKMISFLLREFEGTPIVLLLTTHVADEKRDARVVVRNGVVSAIANKYGLPVIDIYKISKEHGELLCSDGVHFTKEGYELLAKELTDALQGGKII